MNTLTKLSIRGLLLAASVSLQITIIAAATNAPGDPGWPRQMQGGNSVVTVHQPQIDDWKDYKEITLRSAIGVRGKSDEKEQLGVLEGTAQTTVDTKTRNVVLSQLKYTLRFPSLEPEVAANLERDVRTAMPGTRTMTISLDRVIAYLEKDKASLQKEVPVSIDPPQIFYSDKPAVLVMFMGEPKFSPVKEGDNSLLYAVNTNWDLFQSTADQKYYLRVEDSWLESSATDWVPATKLPASLNALPADANWEEVRKHIPGTAPKVVSKVIQTTQPAELILTDGAPAMRNIPGTQVMQVTNTPSLLFMNGSDQQYYFLVAGRWFSAKQLAGPWQPSTRTLPEDFTKIPPTDQIAEVRSSIAGTPESQDAILLASVPTLATVAADEASLQVLYEGEPKFIPIPETNVQYAINSPMDVFLVNGKYYCCSEGVWFCSTAPAGPWGLCQQVDQEIYSIPSSHPKHNVTYVNVYDSGTDNVTYGYTSGYTGSYVNNGLLVFGAGLLTAALLDDDNNDYDDYYYHYPAPLPYYSYGMAAHYNYASGSYYGAASYYGPYNGAGRYAAYNPSTGTYSRGAAAYGPYSSAGVREAYNPWTDTYAAQARVNTPGGSAGRFYAERDGEEVWGGSRSGPKGSVGWAQSDEGAKAAGWDTKRNEGAAVKNKQGDVVVGNDGNLYKQEDGNWQKYDDGDWDNVDRPEGAGERAAGERSAAGQAAAVASGAALGAAGTHLATGQNKAGLQGNITGNTNAAQNRTGTQVDNRTGAQVDNRAGNQATARPSQPIDKDVYSNLEQQTTARDRGNANADQYQRAATADSSASRASTANRQSPPDRSSSANRSSSSNRSGSSGSSGSASRSSSSPKPSSSASRPSGGSSSRPAPSSASRGSSGGSRGGGGGGGRR